jgi:hypothetical protein
MICILICASAQSLALVLQLKLYPAGVRGKSCFDFSAELNALKD